MKIENNVESWNYQDDCMEVSREAFQKYAWALKSKSP